MSAHEFTGCLENPAWPPDSASERLKGLHTGNDSRPSLKAEEFTGGMNGRAIPMTCQDDKWGYLSALESSDGGEKSAEAAVLHSVSISVSPLMEENLHEIRLKWDPWAEPWRVLLVQASGGTSQEDWDQNLWLQPLPGLGASRRIMKSSHRGGVRGSDCPDDASPSSLGSVLKGFSWP